MNWEAIGAAGEVLGAVGVIATLGYLAFQIRQNTEQLQQNELASSSWFGCIDWALGEGSIRFF